MPTIYVLLILTVLAFVLYVTWRPSRRGSAHSAPKQRPTLNKARGAATAPKVADLPTLDFPMSNAPGKHAATRRR